MKKEPSIEKMAEVIEAFGWDYAESSDGTGDMFVYWDHTQGDMPKWCGDNMTSCECLEDIYRLFMESKEELAIRAAKLFPELFPDVWKHDKGGWLGWDVGCNKCTVIIKRNTKPNHLEGTLVKTEEHDKPCTVPTPIDINDWNVAMRLRDEIIKKLGWGVWEYNFRMQRRRQSCPDRPEYTPDTPADYIEAACVAKEAENERT